MDELIEYLRGVAENANLPQYMRDRLTEAAAALEAAREDAARYRHLRSNESSGHVDLCVCRIEWSKQGNVRARYEVLAEDRADQAIDQARGKGGGEVEGG